MSNPTILLAFSPTLTASAYESQRYRMILPLEERSGVPSQQMYIDPVGIATIGAGFNINVQARAILTVILGRVPSAAEINAIVNATVPPFTINSDATRQALQNTLDNALRQVTGNNSISFRFASNSDIEATFNLIAKSFEDQVDAWLPGIPTGRERLVLLDLAYNGVLGQSRNLRAAIVAGNRAEAWFQIRYGSNGKKSESIGIAKRRFYESSLFGLYANLNRATEQEAKNSYQMLTAHRAEIFSYETKWGLTPDGQVGVSRDLHHRTGLQAVTQDYSTILADANLSTINIPSLVNQLAPAYAAFIAYANTVRGEGSPDIDGQIISNAAAIYFGNITVDSQGPTALLDARGDDNRPGNNLNNNLLVGSGVSDTEYGGSGRDYLLGLAGNDFLDGGTGDDTLIGGANDDRLSGGLGTDTYVFKAGDGSDTIVDADGLGIVRIGTSVLTGADQANYFIEGIEDVWIVGDGEIIYSLDKVHQILVISGSTLGADNDVTINNVDVGKLTGDEGYLGIKLKRDLKAALVQGIGSNVFGQAAANRTAQSTDLVEGTGTTFTFYLNQAAKAGETVTLSLSGLADKFKVILGDSVVDANGAVITLAQGQTQVSFALVQQGDITASSAVQLSATYNGQHASVTSNDWTVNLQDTGEVGQIKNGDQRAKIIGQETQLSVQPADDKYGTYAWNETSWAANGSLTNGVAAPDFSDVLWGGAGNDKLNGLGGNDALDGGAGNDQIDGGTGDDLIGGGAGSDNIKGGDGNDYINTSATLNVPQRFKPNDSWSAPPGKEVLTQGAVWGIYKDTVGNTAVAVWSGSDSPAGSDSDVVDAGAGDDCVIASAGDDRVQGGSGDDQIDGMAGNDVLEGGDGADNIDGDGLIKTGFMNSVAAVQHGNDFLDGGTGNDELKGGGGNDVVFGGADNDEMWGDDGGKVSDADYVDPAFHGNDYLDGEDGNDYVEGGGKADVLYGGSGNDTLWGDTSADNVDTTSAKDLIWGNDYIDGEDGNDQLIGGGRDDTLYGGVGDDALFGDESKAALGAEYTGADFLDGGAGKDSLVGGGKDDTLYGGAGNDYLVGDDTNMALGDEYSGNDYLDGQDDDDQLIGGGKDDILLGGSGNDVLYGGLDSDQLWGESGRDTLMGGQGDDYLDGGENEDRLDGGEGNDVIYGQAGLDKLDGGTDDDILDGGDSDDILTGGDGADLLRGGVGNDMLNGDSGSSGQDGVDVLEGGAGNDMLNGGGRGDTYVFSIGDGLDTIQDDGSDGSYNSIGFRFASDQVRAVRRQGVDLLLDYGTSDSVRVQGFYSTNAFGLGYQGDGASMIDQGEAQARIAEINFEDGTVWSIDDILGMAPAPVAGEGPDDPFADLHSVYFINALLSRDEIKAAGKATLSFSFASVAANGLIGAVPFTEEQKQAVREAFAHFSSVLDLQFTEVADGSGADLNFTLDDLTSVGLGAFSGYTEPSTGEIHLNSTLFAQSFVDEFGVTRTRDSLSPGKSGFATLLHEIGHALGLKHPFESPFLPSAENTSANTVMSYTQIGDPATGLADFDIAALQFLYGVASSRNSGDSSYTFADRFVDDGGGIDTFDASAESQDMTINLAPGSWNHLGAKAESILADGQAFIGFGTQIENAIGGSGNDRLDGTSASNLLYGGGGADSITGGAGDDTIAGAMGTDTYYLSIGDGQDTLIESGVDSVVVIKDATLDSLRYFDGRLYYGTIGDSVQMALGAIGQLIIGGVSYSGDEFREMLEADVVLAPDQISGQLLGNNNSRLTGNALGNKLTGNAGKNTLAGNQGNDTLDGGGGDDQLIGGQGSDVYLFGRDRGAEFIDDAGIGADVDVLRLDVGISPADLRFDKNQGEQNLRLRIVGTNDSVSFRSPDDTTNRGIERIEFSDGTVWTQSQWMQRYFSDIATEGNDYVLGFNVDDSIVGAGGDDRVFSGSGNDTLIGGMGRDSLYGQDGNDVLVDGQFMSGGDGNDTYVLSNWANVEISDQGSAASSGADRLLLPAGTDPATVAIARPFYDNDQLLIGGLAIDAYFNGNSIETIEFADGTKWTMADVLARDSNWKTTGGEDFIKGLRSNDSFDGMGGDDKIGGFQGNDTLLGGAGDDSLYGDNMFVTNATSADGNDLLDGGAGNDDLNGGGGDDIYSFGHGGGKDTIHEVAGMDAVRLEAGIRPEDVDLARLGYDLVLVLGRGRDQITVQGHFSGPAQKIDRVEFADGTVWDASQIAARTVVGQPNSMQGTAGDDTFMVDDWRDEVVEGVGQGIDTVQSSVEYTLDSNVENLTLVGFLNMAGHGNDLNNVLIGNSSDNYLDGGAGFDTVSGGVGNDTLSGNGNRGIKDSAVDVLVGGSGDDTYLVSLADQDTIVEGTNGGVDTVQLNIEYTGIFTYQMSSNVENVILQSLTGSFISVQNLHVLGSDQDNFIKIDSDEYFNNTIDGGVGADTMIGSLSGNTFYVDNVGDVVSIGGVRDAFNPVARIDTVVSSVDWILGNELERLQLTGSAKLGVGNSLGNIMIGNGRNDRLEGLAGNDTFLASSGMLDIYTLSQRVYSSYGVDTLAGGSGDDSYSIDWESGWHDVVVEQVGEGQDTVVMGSVLLNNVNVDMSRDLANVETLDFSGSFSSITGTNQADHLIVRGWTDTVDGGAGADLIEEMGLQGVVYANQGGHLLRGGAGNDTIAAGGNDTLDGGSGDDIFSGRGSVKVIFGRGYGYDTWTVANSDETSQLLLGSGLSFSDLNLQRAGTALTLSFGLGDAVTIANYFVDASGFATNNSVAVIRQSDGFELDSSYLIGRLASGNGNQATDGSDLFLGSHGSDVLTPGAGNDLVLGGEGDDSIVGGSGDDLLLGEAGNDTYFFGTGDGIDSIRETAGSTDRILLASGITPATVSVKRAENLSDLLIALPGGADVLRVEGYFIAGTDSIETLQFSDGTIWNRAAIEYAASHVTGTAGDDILFGGAGNDVLSGLAGADTLRAGAGADTLDGGAGNDDLALGSGTDVVLFGRGDGVDFITSDERLEVAEDDVLSFKVGINPADVTYKRIAERYDASSDTALELSIVGSTDKIVISGFFSRENPDNPFNAINRIAFPDGTVWARSHFANLARVVTGTSAANILNGTSKSDRIIGLDGNDSLAGSGGNDALEGGNGADTLNGGTGDDYLLGGDGIDSLIGGAGADEMVGGVGDDVYVADLDDFIVEAVGEGRDVVQTSSDGLTLSANVEDLLLSGTSGIGATGNSGNNKMTGNSGSNSLSGEGGDDWLIGNAGNDFLVGGDGNDLLEGGDGQDNLEGDTGNNILRGNAGDDNIWTGAGTSLLDGGAGNDQFNYDTATGNVAMVIGGAGNDLISLPPSTGDQIVAMNRGDGIDSVAPKDDDGKKLIISLGEGISTDEIAINRMGNDIYLSLGSDLITLPNWLVGARRQMVLQTFNAQGMVSTYDLSATFKDYIEAYQANPSIGLWNAAASLTAHALGSSWTEAYGGGLAYQYAMLGTLDGMSRESIGHYLSVADFGAAPTDIHESPQIGTDGSDLLVGTASNDELRGKAGNDTLDGGFGTDTLLGGSGDDSYLIDSIGDKVVELAAEGIDSINSMVSYALADNLENLVLLGNAGLSGAGNELDNAIAGNDRANLLSGGAGNDTLKGGAGNDTIDGGLGNDIYVFNVGDGADTIGARASEIPDVVEMDTLSFGVGIRPQDVTVSFFDGVGGPASGVLLSLRNGTDSVRLDRSSNGSGWPHIAFVDGTVWGAEQVFDAWLAHQATGGNDTLYGDQRGNVIAGSRGDDWMLGQGGDDTYLFSEGDGFDTIYDLDGVTTIRFDASVRPEDVDVMNFQIRYGELGVISLAHAVGANESPIGRIEFSDGTVWTGATLSAAAGTGSRFNDVLFGTDQLDVLLGKGGNDTLIGQEDSDTLEGGLGDDVLQGGAGGDLYIYRVGDGSDTVYEQQDASAEIDTLRFDTGIEPNAIGAQRSGEDLILSTGVAGQQVLVSGWFSGQPQRIERFEFADGTVWVQDDIAAIVVVPQITEGDDVVVGTDGNDSIDALGGDDNITGNSGADLLVGGEGRDLLTGGLGNDILQGGAGADQYVFAAGDGNDIVEDLGDSSDWSDEDSVNFGAGISSADIRLLKDASGADLTLHNVVTGDDLTVKGWFTEPSNRIERFNFADDGESWSAFYIGAHFASPSEGDDGLWGTTGDDTMNGLGGDDNILGDAGADLLTGGNGNDSLAGGMGDDTLIGGAEADYLSGDDGDDTYLFSAGWGQDSISDFENGGIDRNLVKLTGVPAAGISITRDADSIYLKRTGSNDILMLTNWFSQRAEGESTPMGLRVEFDDGTVWAAADLLARIDSMEVSGGRDYWYGSDGDEIADAGDGDDAVDGAGGNDILYGGNGDDSLIAREGHSVLFGGAGFDGITGVGGTNVLIGGTGDDGIYNWDSPEGQLILFNAGDGNDYVNTQGHDDVADVISVGQFHLADFQIEASPYSTDFVLRFGTEDSLTFSDFASRPVLLQVIDGDSIRLFDLSAVCGDLNAAILEDWDLPGWDAYSSLQSHLLSSSTTEAIGGALAYRYAIDGTVSGVDAHTIQQILAAPELTSVAQSILHTIVGTAGNDNLVGTAGGDLIQGLTGDDTLDGGAGGDTMEGGAGNDLYVVDNIGDMVTEEVSSGADQVRSAISYVLASQVENLTLTGSVAINGGGNSLDNVLSGNISNNALTGGLGNDTLDGGQGNDTLVGGGGNDVYIVDASSDLVTENTGEGTDTIQSSVTLTLASNVENLVLAGSGAINGTGNALNNVLGGNGAANTLSGGTGNDTMSGGAGDDIYVVDMTGDVVTENSGEGVDLVQSGVTYTLSSNVENLLLTGSGAVNGIGNGLTNVLTGNSGANTLTGGAGNDTMDGGVGNDTMLGGVGDDTYILNVISDVVTEAAGEGTDTVQIGLTYTLAANVENLLLTGSSAISGTGNTLDNTLTGNGANNTLAGSSGNDALNGGLGNDTMVGGAGSDVYWVDTVTDVVTENANEGTDTVQSSVSLTLVSNVENLVLTGSGAINGTGNTLNNALAGNSAANNLNGGTGNDTMAGGAGDDVYVVDAASDVVTENAGEGTDSIQSGVTYALSINVENLTLTGSGTVSGTGNGLNNMLTGNGVANSLTGGAGNDTLDGGVGTDTLVGGTGDDVFILNVATDVVTEAAGEGTDTVKVGATYTLGNNVENLILTGTAAINGTGNALDNVLTGNSANNTLAAAAGNDTLDGDTGNDTMVGGAGNDTYYANVSTDVITENASEGTDTIVSSVTWTLATNLENLTLGGTTAINGTGNSVANMLTGNSVNNTLTGAAGNDVLDGGAGNDNLIGGIGADNYVFGRGYGLDTVVENDSTAGTIDMVQFGANVLQSDILFSKSGNSLLASLVGSSDVLKLQDWYLGSQYHVEQFRFSDGSVLTDSQAQALVGAMAGFEHSGSAMTENAAWVSNKSGIPLMAMV